MAVYLQLLMYGKYVICTAGHFLLVTCLTGAAKEVMHKDKTEVSLELADNSFAEQT